MKKGFKVSIFASENLKTIVYPLPSLQLKSGYSGKGKHMFKKLCYDILTFFPLHSTQNDIDQNIPSYGNDAIWHHTQN